MSVKCVYVYSRLISAVFVFYLVSGCGTSTPSFTVEKTGVSSSDAFEANPSDNMGRGEVEDVPIFPSDVSENDEIMPEAVAAANENGNNSPFESVAADEENLYPKTEVFEKDGKIITIFSDKSEGNELYETVTIRTEQKLESKVDILWVVDNSGSMEEEQNYLSQNFSSFISLLMSQPIDFQVAVTTTDICQQTTPTDLTLRYCPSAAGSHPKGTHNQGKFRGAKGEQILNGSASNLLTKFSEYVNVGTNGSSFEHGLKAADLAIELSEQGTTNDSLVRSDAFLAVIVVSDEQDDGIGISEFDAYTLRNFWDEGLTRFRFTEDDMITALNNRKGEGKFAISAITPVREADGSLCSAPHSKPVEEGTQYIKAAQKSGGIIQSICEVNWSESLAKMGLDLTAQISQISLEGKPDVATLKVEFDGVLYEKWQYIEGSNALKFDPNDLPPPGAKISIFYYKAGN